VKRNFCDRCDKEITGDWFQLSIGSPNICLGAGAEFAARINGQPKAFRVTDGEIFCNLKCFTEWLENR
jgi:hypothetical protein